jgi:hypothetical protein
MPTAIGGERSISLAGWASVQVPAGWHTTAYRGIPAPVFFPLRFVSSAQFAGPCASGPMKAECTTKNWFPETWQPRPGEVIVLWSHSEVPGDSVLRHRPGARITIDRRPAKLWTGAATSKCPVTSGSEIDASIVEEPRSYPGDGFDMTACFGPGANDQNREAVMRMLHSLDVRR